MANERKIIIVDDEEIIRSMLKEVLPEMLKETELDCLISTFSEPKEVLEIEVGIKEFCLIISDYNMPGMNGIELIKKVKIINPNIKVILMSGLDFEEAKRKMGGEFNLVDELVSKPFDWLNFKNLIIKLLK
jgi:YesN/AraC family two-component response regulator